jgi:hypothetical protein
VVLRIVSSIYQRRWRLLSDENHDQNGRSASRPTGSVTFVKTRFSVLVNYRESIRDPTVMSRDMWQKDVCFAPHCIGSSCRCLQETGRISKITKVQSFIGRFGVPRRVERVVTLLSYLSNHRYRKRNRLRKKVNTHRRSAGLTQTTLLLRIDTPYEDST